MPNNAFRGNSKDPWNFNYDSDQPDTFSYVTDLGGPNETISGKVCLLGIGDTVTGDFKSDTVGNGETTPVPVSVPNNPDGALSTTLGSAVWAYWTEGADDHCLERGQR